MATKDLSIILHELDLLLHQEIDNELKPFELSVEQSRIIELLHERGTMCQNEIAMNLNKNKATITRMLNSLEKKQFITKEKDPENWKQNNISLTEKGLGVFEEIMTVSKEINQRIEKNITTSEKEKLIELVNKIADGLIK
ncbi:hypothetical protein BAU15_11500 [Enterococcus sp. JM4C]|uniref:MarR family winged helix-turn-helix transcriptional regulator n=1 Tax=Candidatus Enterococcus huntleyi TaxID=1857217 RepID=UPI00137B190F|nr:MarR family transcriptional regulator [Enterococcus sp. JM4C]KAF1297368.1 hypothetical protein BAU15_11500 [Enterococcus sp. JM4C]